VASSLFPVHEGVKTFVIQEAGGSPQAVILADRDTSFPVWSADGSALLLRSSSSGGGSQWRVASLDGVDRGAIGEGPFNNAKPDYWDSNGYVYYSVGDADSTDLWRVEVSPQSARVLGGPERMLASTGSFRGPSLARDGRLVYADLT
jgi:Tol biopolymer transport system component